MLFPNPVLPSDPPMRRRRWPRVAALLVGLTLLGLALLPPFLHTHLGLKLVRLYLHEKFPLCTIVLNDFRTSWLGPTSAEHLIIQAPDGHGFGCQYIQADISLGRLLCGSWRLGGHAQLDGLQWDYVISYRDGSSSFSRLLGLPATSRDGASFPEFAMPSLSGDIAIHDATINVSREHVEPDTLRTLCSEFQLSHVQGTIHIPSLDQQGDYELSGTIGTQKSPMQGTVRSSGQFQVGQGNRVSPKTLNYHLLVEGEHWPTMTVGPTLVPLWSANDYRDALGTQAQKVTIVVQAADGEIHVNPLTIHSQRPANIQLALKYDMNSVPRRWTREAGSNTLEVGVPREYARRVLVHMVPLLGEVTDDGNLLFHLESLSLPPQPFARQQSISGDMQIHGAKLDVSTTLAAHDVFKGLMRQILSVTGPSTAPARPTLDAQGIQFTFANGELKVKPASLTVANTHMNLSGTSVIGGPLQMVLTLCNPAKLSAAVPELATGSVVELVIPLTGTAQEPRLDLERVKNALPPSVARKLDDFIAAQIAALRAQDAQKQRPPPGHEIPAPIKPPASQRATGT